MSLPAGWLGPSEQSPSAKFVKAEQMAGGTARGWGAPGPGTSVPPSGPGTLSC